MIKAIFFDIDGTLVSFKTHRIPKSTLDALYKLKEKGIKLFIATGRPRKVINNLGDFPFDGYVTMNGSYCYSKDNETIYKDPIPQEDVNNMANILEKEKDCPCVIVAENDLYICNRNKKVEEFRKMLEFPDFPDITTEEIKKLELYQISPFFTYEQENKYIKILPSCESSRWHPMFTDLVSKGNAKSLGIDHIIKHYGINLNETMSFGDGGNDISMIKHTNIGVAMGNAFDEVKEIADYVTDTIDNDGVLKALKHYNIL